METLVLALIALRNEFRRSERPVAEPEFEPFNLSACTRSYSVEDAGPKWQRPARPATGAVRQATL